MQNHIYGDSGGGGDSDNGNDDGDGGGDNSDGENDGEDGSNQLELGSSIKSKKQFSFYSYFLFSIIGILISLV